jgi:hypothetical protein
MFNFNKMSPTEFKFIQTYVTALRRDYWMLQTAIELTKSDQLAVRDIVRAARLAKTMQEMHEGFEADIDKLAATGTFFRKKAGTPRPTIDDLSELFALSFFKVMTTIKADAKPVSKHDAGWFSGDPHAWQNVFDNLQKNPPFNSVLTDCLKVLGKIFPEMKNLKNYYSDEDYKYDAPLNFWPGNQLDHGEHNDEDEDDWYET